MLGDAWPRAAQLRVRLVVRGEALEQHDRVPLGRAVLQAEDREAAHGGVAVGGRQRVQQRPHAVDRARMVAREQLEREQRRAAARRALVVEPAPQQLLLRAPAELPDRAKRDRALAEVGAARGALEIVGPLRAEIRQLALGAALRELVALSRSLGERHAGTPAAAKIAADRPVDVLRASS